MRLVRRAIEEPLRQIARNAGAEGSVVVEKVREGKGAFGFNAATDQYEDLLKAGVIDPTKVVRMALEYAASVSGMMLTTEATISDKPKKESLSRRRRGRRHGHGWNGRHGRDGGHGRNGWHGRHGRRLRHGLM